MVPCISKATPICSDSLISCMSTNSPTIYIQISLSFLLYLYVLFLLQSLIWYYDSPSRSKPINASLGKWQHSLLCIVFNAPCTFFISGLEPRGSPPAMTMTSAYSIVLLYCWYRPFALRLQRHSERAYLNVPYELQNILGSQIIKLVTY
jgi:hypothetical protein